jgi:hypothetical protein
MKRERFTTTIDPDLIEKTKILAIKKRIRFNDLIEEALRDLLKKYQDNPPKPSK